jgi:hypothetical protein
LRLNKDQCKYLEGFSFDDRHKPTVNCVIEGVIRLLEDVLLLDVTPAPQGGTECEEPEGQENGEPEDSRPLAQGCSTGGRHGPARLCRELEADIAALKDQLLRALAEQKNIRMRANRERDDSVRFCRPLVSIPAARRHRLRTDCSQFASQ